MSFETIKKPALKNFCEIFEGEPFARKVHEAVNDSALSINTITRHIQTIAADLKEQIAQVQLLIFGRFLKESSIIEKLLACISLEKPQQEAKIFLMVLISSLLKIT